MRKESINSSVPVEAAGAVSAAHLLHPATQFNHPRAYLRPHISAKMRSGPSSRRGHPTSLRSNRLLPYDFIPGRIKPCPTTRSLTL